MRWHIGEIRITSIVEQDLTDLAILIPGATAQVLDEVEWLRPNFLDARGQMTGLIQAFVVETSERKIVIDTCVGNDKERPAIEAWHRKQRAFLEKFESAGYPPTSIDVVLCTHMHFDHVGWNTYLDGGKWKPTFPNARYLFAEDEFRYWEKYVEGPVLDPSRASSESEMIHALLDGLTRQTRLDSILPIVEVRLSELVPHDHEVCAGVRLAPTPGHTPGHVSVEITSEGEAAFITGDAIHHPVQIARPELHTVADSNCEEAHRTRDRILLQLARDGTLLIGSHFSTPTAGYVHRRPRGFRHLPDKRDPAKD
jgi:glyoxylase-like metal-dependent hydrolase (beta-lactamase superfamily II)